MEDIILRFYNEKAEKVYECYGLSLEDGREYPEKYFDVSGYEKIYCYLEDFKNPTIEGNGIRELTREELIKNGRMDLLEDGEIFEDGEIKNIQRPSLDHTWNGKEWTVDLDKIRENKRRRFKEIRTKKQNEDFEFQGHIFQATENDMRNIETKYNSITMLDKLGQDIKPYLSQTIKWTLKDNSQIDMLVSDILQLYIAWDKRRTDIFNYCNDVLYDKLKKATTYEELIAINWD